MRPVRSGPSRRACFLRFINCTSRKADVVWIDYNGFAVNYGTLEPERHFDIHTYEGHPWFCTDATLRTRLLLNKEKIFYPSASDQENAEPNRELRNNRPVLTNKENIHNENDDLHQCRREIVYITIPGQLYMLAYIYLFFSFIQKCVLNKIDNISKLHFAKIV